MTFSLLNLGGNGIAPATLPGAQFDVPNENALASGLSEGAYAIGKGLERRGAETEILQRRAEAEARRQAAIAKELNNVENERWLTNYNTRLIDAHSAAMDATRGMDSIDQANSKVEEVLAPRSAELDEIADPLTKAKAQEAYARIHASAHDQATSRAFSAGVEQFAADKAAQLQSLSQSVMKGDMPPEIAQSIWAVGLIGNEKNFGGVRSREMLIHGSEQIGVAAFNSLVNTNAEGALQFLKTDYATNNIPADKLGDLTRHAMILKDEQQKQAVAQTEQYWTEQANQNFLNQTVPPTPQETSDFFNMAASEISKTSGGIVSEDQARMKLVYPLVQALAGAPAPDQTAFDRMAAQMPKDAHAQDLLNRERDNIRQRLVEHDTAKTEAKAIAGIWNSGAKIPSGQTFSDAGLNVFHNMVNDLVREAQFFNGTGLWPSALQTDLKVAANAPTKENLGTLSNVLQTLDNNHASLMAEELSKQNRELIRTLSRTTRDQSQQERTRIVGVLSDERAVRAMPEAVKQFDGDTKAKIEPMKLPEGMTSDQIEQYRAHFMLNFAEQVTTFNAPTASGDQAATVTTRAKSATDSWMASEYPKVVIPTWFPKYDIPQYVPKSIAGSDPKTVAAFAKAVGDAQSDLGGTRWWSGSDFPLLKPAAGFVNGEIVSVPAVDPRGLYSFMQFDRSTGKSVMVNKTDPQYKTLEDQFNHRAPSGIADPNEDIAWKESFGRVSIQQFDEGHFANRADGYGAKIIARAKKNVPFEGVDPKQYEMLLMQECERLARDAKWPSFLGTTEPNK